MLISCSLTLLLCFHFHFHFFFSHSTLLQFLPLLSSFSLHSTFYCLLDFGFDFEFEFAFWLERHDLTCVWFWWSKFCDLACITLYLIMFEWANAWMKWITPKLFAFKDWLVLSWFIVRSITINLCLSFPSHPHLWDGGFWQQLWLLPDILIHHYEICTKPRLQYTKRIFTVGCIRSSDLYFGMEISFFVCQTKLLFHYCVKMECFFLCQTFILMPWRNLGKGFFGIWGIDWPKYCCMQSKQRIGILCWWTILRCWVIFPTPLTLIQNSFTNRCVWTSCHTQTVL